MIFPADCGVDRTLGTRQRRGMKELRELRRLSFARESFYEAIETCSFLATNEKIYSVDKVYHTICTGLVVTYARPFMESNGLGPLAQKYQKFPGRPELAALHGEVMRARNSLFAHFSPTEASELVPKAISIGQNCKLTFTSGVVTQVHVPATGWAPTSIKALQLLCAFQINRLRPEVINLIEHLKGDADYADGEYEIGVTFSKDQIAHSQDANPQRRFEFGRLSLLVILVDILHHQGAIHQTECW
jgi:hypothetical protein